MPTCVWQTCCCHTVRANKQHSWALNNIWQASLRQASELQSGQIVRVQIAGASVKRLHHQSVKNMSRGRVPEILTRRKQTASSWVDYFSKCCNLAFSLMRSNRCVSVCSGSSSWALTLCYPLSSVHPLLQHLLPIGSVVICVFSSDFNQTCYWNMNCEPCIMSHTVLRPVGGG